MDTADVVIVGGGIAGASLATALAGAGLGVTVLEASTEYEDRVRGESMHAWGVKEARELGVEQTLLDAGAHVAPLWKQYIAGQDPTELPMSIMVDGIDGSLNLRHPDACQALIEAAAAAGATVVRGVKDVQLDAANPGTVSYAVNGDSKTVRSELVVGADGRASTVRKQAGITLEREDPINYICGLLLDGLDGVPDDHDVMVPEGDLFILLFHQGEGRGRSYIVTGASGQHMFAGRGGTDTFMSSWEIDTYPWARQVAKATPAGPCATYPGDDTWTPAPYADGVVLIGDAAGHNDPIIGEGLSISMRDARTVRDLVLDGARKPADFASYGDERMERMRRLRLGANVLGVTNVEDGADNRDARRAWVGERMATMDPELFPLLFGLFAGPENIPAELVDDAILDRIRSA
ncbi:MAG: FAD-dependent monooxygenase [Acidimicrobiia bacterium]|nr:FAD-dependent monooxygenase [Acidimicrobiia bacterium]